MKNKSFGKSESVFYLLSTLIILLNLAIFNQACAAQKIKTINSKSAPANNNSAPPKSRNTSEFAADEFEILALVNAERNKVGLSQMIWDDAVADIAREYSKRMGSENFFGHYDAEGSSVVERAEAVHLKHWKKIGENLFSIANLERFDAFAVKNWMKSPTHRDNILDKDWTTSGIGIARAKDGEIFITQIFIKR